MTQQDYHIFVCMQERPPVGPRGCCMYRGSRSVAEAFRREIAERHLDGRVALTPTVCMGVCGGGANVLVYPDGVVYAGVKEADVAEIVDAHLVGGGARGATHGVGRVLVRSPGAPVPSGASASSGPKHSA